MRRWSRRIATLLRGGRAHREVEEEMGFHLDMEARDLVRQGMAPAEARREARRRFGGTDRHREAVREARRQGVTIRRPDIRALRKAVQGQADAMAEVMAQGLSEKVSREAIRNAAGANLSSDEVATRVSGSLDDLT
ncbi:MAG: permease prefix domain 1-containing protein, partial [Gemmatimonadetes bacterium]|nr:permease prefix domain 1-containing protein [Gemmatimonadota bacterium]